MLSCIVIIFLVPTTLVTIILWIRNWRVDIYNYCIGSTWGGWVRERLCKSVYEGTSLLATGFVIHIRWYLCWQLALQLSYNVIDVDRHAYIYIYKHIIDVDCNAIIILHRGSLHHICRVTDKQLTPNKHAIGQRAVHLHWGICASHVWLSVSCMYGDNVRQTFYIYTYENI